MTTKREQVRENFPHGTAIADFFKSNFGPIRLNHIIEGDKEIGKPGPRGVKVSEIELYGDAFVIKKGKKNR